MKRWLVFAASFLMFVPQGQASNLAGKATFEGQVPEPKEISTIMDPACRKLNPGGFKSQEVLVDDQGGLKNVFVYVQEGLQGKSFPAPSEPVMLDQKGCSYTPRVFGIQVGQILKVLNSDPTLHNVRDEPKKSEAFNLGMPFQNMDVEVSFDHAEIMIPFKCDVHPWMAAYAGVLTHPFYAVTDADGSFSIGNLPPGRYVLAAWHEKYGEQTQSVELLEGKTAEVNFVFTS